MAVVRGGSYDSTSSGANSPGLVTPVQISNFISNLYLLEQIGNFELNHIFAHSQRLNSEAIFAFVKVLYKVSMSELQSLTDPRVFSLTKIVEVAHYNMNRIRLVWSRIWSVLSEFFVAVGLSENLSVLIFVMDSLHQLAMKFLEREELANYNFQNEFLKPFVIVMQKSCSEEIRELIVRCISQMVLIWVNNVKSGWKSVLTVFTAAAADERKTIVLLAFETIEKIVREYFSHMTETETITFTDCVKCLITFTSSKFDSDVSLNAIAFLRFFAVRLAEDGLASEKIKGDECTLVEGNALESLQCKDKDDLIHFWVTLLSGLSRLTSDPRSAIRKSALEVLFNILMDHGHLFSQPFWSNVFSSVILPIFNFTRDSVEDVYKDDRASPNAIYPESDGTVWDAGTSAIAVECLIDLFVHFYNDVQPQLHEVINVLAGFIKNPGQGPSSIGVASLMRLVADLRGKLYDDEWKDIFLCLKEVAGSTLPEIFKLLKTMDNINLPDINQASGDMESDSLSRAIDDDLEDESLQAASYVASRMKSHISGQLLIVQVVTDLYIMHWQSLSLDSVTILLDIYSSIASHSHDLNSETILLLKLEKACSILETSGPPVVHFEIESYQNYINFLHDLLMNHPISSEENSIETQLVTVCKQVLKIYLECSGSEYASVAGRKPVVPCFIPLGTARKEELAARTPLVLSVMRILASLERESFRRYVSQLFPLLADLVRSEHGSREVQLVLSNIFLLCIGPILMKSP